MAAPRDPFDLRLNDKQHQVVANWACRVVTDALDARGSLESDVDYWHALYEQARTRAGHMPWPDAADLTSYLASEKVDALHARMLRTIWSDPLYSVEGWGEAADRAPFVEEFHAWKVEEERLQSVLDKLLLTALIEPRGLLEVSEGTELRTSRKRLNAKIQTDPMTGGVVFGEDGAPQPLRDPSGRGFVEAQANEPAATMVVDSSERVRIGPVYRILPYRDSLILPGHARDKDDIWGYGKRFWRRYDNLKRKAAAGIYDQEAVDKITGGTDREMDPALQRSQATVIDSEPSQGEKELWEILVLVDLNDLFDTYDAGSVRAAGTGARWYLLTLHLPTFQILRIQFDDFERSRFVPVILFPRPDRATEGFSLIGHKLLTVIEEHTAVRNMRADRSSMAVQAPIKRLAGALWDPLVQPFGPKAVIDVRDMNEVQPMVVPDVTSPLVQWAQDVERTAERLAGINDIAAGQFAEQRRTATETSIVNQASAVRIDLLTHRFQEALEDIAQIRHAIWKRVLAEQPEGVQPPSGMLSNLEGRGVSIDKYLPQNGKITAALLDGPFRFKPRGSVDTADPAKERADFMAFLQTLPMITQAFPMLAQWWSTPQAARAMGRQFLRLFHIENQQAFIGNVENEMTGGLLMPPPPPMMGMPGMPPGPLGLPTGMPPPPMGLHPPLPPSGGHPAAPGHPPLPMMPGPRVLQ